MTLARNPAVLAVALALALPGAAWGWGAPGCTNLPEYNRALGALQGMTSACDMSVEEARRVVAAHDGPAPAMQPAAPAQPAGHRRLRARTSPR